MTSIAATLPQQIIAIIQLARQLAFSNLSLPLSLSLLSRSSPSSPRSYPRSPTFKRSSSVHVPAFDARSEVEAYITSPLDPPSQSTSLFSIHFAAEEAGSLSTAHVITSGAVEYHVVLTNLCEWQFLLQLIILLLHLQTHNPSNLNQFNSSLLYTFDICK